MTITACGDEKGYPSLEAFYGASPDQESSSSGGSSSGSGSSSGGTSTNVSCSISTSGLLAYLPLDGDARVLGGALRMNYVPSASSFVSGQYGEALSASKQLFLEATRSLSLSSWTACAWVRVSSESNIGFLAVPGDQALNSGVADRGLIAGCGNGEVTPYVTGSNIGCVVASESGFLFDAWNFLCIVNDPSAGGVQINVNAGTASPGGRSLPLSIPSGASIAIGGGPAGSNAIDEFSLWSRALSRSEIETLAATRCTARDGESP